MKTISTPKAPAAIGPYSQAKVVNGIIDAIIIKTYFGSPQA